MDDFIITGDDEKEIRNLKENLISRQLEVKDLGQLMYFLVIEITRSQKGIVSHKENIS